jgi:hypothetical protein
MLFFWVVTPCGFATPEDGDSMVLRNVGIYRRINRGPKIIRTASSFTDCGSWDINDVSLKPRLNVIILRELINSKTASLSDECYELLT